MQEHLSVDEFNRSLGKLPHKAQPTEAQKVIAKSKRHKLQDAFLAAWRIVRIEGWPDPEMEYRFHDVRKWRLDFAFPTVKVAVEIQGGNFVGGGHNRGAKQAKDFEKLNTATRMGWRVLQFGTKQMGRPLEVAQEVVDAIIELTTTPNQSE